MIWPDKSNDDIVWPETESQEEGNGVNCVAIKSPAPVQLNIFSSFLILVAFPKSTCALGDCFGSQWECVGWIQWHRSGRRFGSGQGTCSPKSSTFPGIPDHVF